MRRRKPPAAAPDLSKRIRADREGAGMAQETVARAVGVSLSAYRNWERVYPPPTQRLPEIAKALGLPENHYIASEAEHRTIMDALNAIEERQLEIERMMDERNRLLEEWMESRDKPPQS